MSVADFEAWAIFVTIAENGSFAAAARALGRSVPTVSRAIARLEGRLGGALFHRNSRRLSLSTLGEEALPDARELVAAARELEERVGEARSDVAGLIRLAAPHEFGHQYLAPILPEFLAAHPQVKIEMILDDARIDIMAAGADIVLRIGDLGDSRLIARQLCGIDFHIVASPQGIARFGMPRHPSDLSDLPCLLYSNPASVGSWRFLHRNGTQISVAVDGPLLANSGGSLMPALNAGLGIAIYPDFLLGSMIEDGSLIRLLPEWTVPSTALHMVTPPATLRPLRVRFLMNYLIEKLAKRSGPSSPPA